MKRFLLIVSSTLIILVALAAFPSKGARAGGLGDALLAVTAVSEDDAWAAGQFFVPGPNSAQALLEHWDGHVWRMVPAPSTGTQFSQLRGLAAISSNDVWAVGLFTSANGIEQPLTEHWNGTQWKIVSVPTPAGIINSWLSGVAAVSHNDVWAVGEVQDSNGFLLTLIEHWNGHIWQVVSSPNPAQQTNALLGVAAASDDDVWAVGFFLDTTNTTQALVERWDGHNWQIIPSTAPATSSLSAVAATSSHDVWAAGNFFDTKGTYQALVEHRYHHSWQTITGLNPAGSSAVFLTGVAAVSPKNVWVVGSVVGTGGSTLTLTEHWDGHTWQVVSSPNPSGANSTFLQSVAAVPHEEDLWAVGNTFKSDGSTSTLIEAWNGSSWSIVPSPTF